ncbi:MAG: hypothetical protein KC766_12690 [Myxococcales bacterium]|nr:hypothetical protein [Myxococcales bacterium]
MPTELSQLSALAKQAIDAAVASALAIDAPGYEEEGEIADLLAAAQAALATTREAYGQVLQQLDGFLGSRPQEVVRLADAAFIGRFATGQLAAELGRAESNPERWAKIRAASKVRRELLRSLRSADLLVCQLLGCKADTSYYLDELQHALAARHAYSKLRTEANRANGEDLDLSLRRAATTLAKLVGRDCYPDLRIHDRMLVRQLQGRMRRWFAQSEASEDLTLDGQRLLGEYHNFVEIALEVNKRPELIEHDRCLLTQLLVAWDELSQSEIVDTLTHVLGRDGELDSQLSNRHYTSLRGTVEQVLTRLGGMVSTHSLAIEATHPASKAFSS